MHVLWRSISLNGGRDSFSASAQHVLKSAISPNAAFQAQNRNTMQSITSLKRRCDSDDEFIYLFKMPSKQPETMVNISNIPIKVVLDAGSSVNLFRVFPPIFPLGLLQPKVEGPGEKSGVSIAVNSWRTI